MADRTVEVGYIVKAHGLKGDVIVALTTNRHERVSPGATLICSGQDLKIVSSSPHQGRWIVHFEGVDDREAAEHLRGETLLAAPILDDSEVWIHEISGLPVYDQQGKLLGAVVALELNPASDLLVLDSGLLVPLIFLKDGDLDYHKTGVLHVEIPEGLLESGS